MGNLRFVINLVLLAVFVSFVSCNEDEIKPSEETLAINQIHLRQHEGNVPVE
ncbi:MAG: hypothetical protein U5K79_17085 [Cyclobacteriaceae bacterium]|nr:hypothetical protein [Cyclobacteriaceae bacterium]